MKTWRDKYIEIFQPYFDLNIKIEDQTRPHKYSDISVLAHKICEWFIERRENNLGISVISLCVFLGIIRPTLDNMKQRSKEFKELIDTTKACIEEFWVECLGTSETAAKFILSAMEGYTTIEKQIVEADNFVINVRKPS